MQAAIEELAVILSLENDDLMAMMGVYFDDSGTHAESDIAVAACFVSDVNRWARFQPSWEAVLNDAGILAHGFHMADFVARKPPFDWSEQKRDQIIKSLISVIGTNVLAGRATAVIKKDYDALVTGQLRTKLGDHHYTFAVASCLAYLEQWLAPIRQPMEYVFDRTGKGKHEIIDLFDSLAASDEGTKFGIERDGYSFQSRNRIVQLQAADVLAWEANKYMRECQLAKGEPRKSCQNIVENVDVRARFFDATTLPAFVDHVTAGYEATGWKGPLGGFLPRLESR